MSERPPATWSIDKHGLPPRPIRIVLDGEEQRAVTAYNVDEGWLDAFCTDPSCSAYRHDRPGKHAVRKRGGELVACRAPRAFGVVAVEYQG